MSTALREGWGTFFEIWAWNRRDESDCSRVIRDDTGKDFDLDGVVDAEVEMDCIGTPYPGTDPLGAPMDDKNWLADLEAADDDDVDGLQCGSEPGDFDHEFNRATVYDTAKMLWHLTERDTDPIEPEVLADIYVDACPRDWAGADICFDDDSSGRPSRAWTRRSPMPRSTMCGTST